MQKIVDRYIFDILLGQVDRKPENWLLAEYADGRVDVAPSFDNARIFMQFPSSSALGMTSENVTLQNIHKARFLENDVVRFMELSSIEFRNRFVESLWVLKEQNVTSIMDSIKHSPCHRSNKELTDKYQKLCAFQLDFLLETLGLKEVPITKFTDTEGLLARSNERGHMTTQVVIPEIAVSIITPNQTVHVLNIDGTLDHHSVLYTDALKKMYESSSEDLENSCIFMRHVIHDANRKYVIVHIPYHITNSMLEQLSSLVAELKQGGYKVFSAIEPFDPITRKKLLDGFRISLETRDPIEYLLSHPDHIADYTWPFEEETIISPNITKERKI